MLESLLKDLERYLDVLLIKGVGESAGKWTVKLSDKEEVTIWEIPSGIHLHAIIGSLPSGNREDLFIHFMQANFLGQGTGESVIGLDPEENFLTLSLSIVYEMNYRIFKDKLEEFFNYLNYWREELNRMEQEAHNK